MSLKILGAFFIILGCGSFGFILAATYRKEERALRQMIAILEYMQCELQYRMLPLPHLCRQAAENATIASIRQVLINLAVELEQQISPNVERCMVCALVKNGTTPPKTREALLLLGRSLGKFDIEGQLKGLDTVKADCKHKLDAVAYNLSLRLRSYQTLSLCAGVALAILFL